MQRALYDPQRGYYTANIRTVGARGDFSTSATHSALLGRAIARWLKQSQARIRCSRFSVIEIGGGNGQLMGSVLDALGWWQRRSVQVFMVEASPVLMKLQRERLGTRVKAWFGTVEQALAACAGEAFIVHNELLDAFPIDLVQYHEGAWREVWSANGTEVLRPLTFDTTHHTVLRTRATEGQRCELHAAVRQWLNAWLPHWKRGAMLSIDYGDEFPALYHRRPHGTLRGYLMQQRLEGAEVYANPGRQDITCDVNFTDVRAWLNELGTTVLSYETQREFIQRMSVAQDESFVLDPDGAGGAFRCLAVERTDRDNIVMK
jgi:SAM-dependent MidA family methyltransferase